jgi:PPP family 3-phenylpropionic acid transporter
MFGATAVLVLVAAAVAFFVLPRGGYVAVRASRGDWRHLLQETAIIRLALFTFAAYACLQGPMGIFPVYIRAHGGDLDTVGRMWIVMLLVEIPLVLLSGAGLARLGPRGLLAAGVFAAAIRWIVCGLSHDLRVIYPMQLLHGVTVVGLLLGAPLYLDAVAPERLRSTGQTLLSMVGVGFGGAASNAAAGWLLERAGANAPYLAGGIGALVLGSCVYWILPPPEAIGGRKPRAGPPEPDVYIALDV